MLDHMYLRFRWLRFSGLWAGAILFSLLLNIAFFSLMPCLTGGDIRKFDHSASVPMVNVVRIRRPDTPPRKKQARKPKALKKPDKELIHHARMRQEPVKQMELPFEINPRLPVGPGTLPTPPMEMFAAPGLNDVYGIGEIDNPLTPISQVPPVYPMRARRRGIEGWVKVKILVTEQGLVNKVEILEAKPKDVFEQSVIRCISSWRFSPGTVQGVPVKTWVATKIRFELESQ